MPEYLRACVVIIFVASMVILMMKPAFSRIVSSSDLQRRIRLWFIITVIVFLANDFWIYIITTIVAIHFAKLRESNYLALYFMLLAVVPGFVSVYMSGFGIVNYTFELNHVRLLALFILLPVALTLSKQTHTLPLGRTTPDKFLIAYLLLTVLLELRGTTLTDTLRQGFYSWLDVLLPYYVASRLLRNMNQFRDVMVSFVVAGLMLAGVAIFEGGKHWLLYSVLRDSLGTASHWGGYLIRGGSLRAMGGAGHPLVLGYMMMVSLGFYLYLQPLISKVLFRYLGLTILIGGLFVAIARGSWIGSLVLIVVFYSLSPNALNSFVKLALGFVLAGILLLALPGGERLIDLLPYVGSIQSETISYREQLFEMGMIVVQQNLWLGSVTFLDTPEMQSMMQGEGIIDLVNSYLSIALNYGLLGLGLFIAFFISVLTGLYRSYRKVKVIDNERYMLGITLFAVLLGSLLVISTVSSILLIPVVYWAVAGMAVGYVEMIHRDVKAQGNQS